MPVAKKHINGLYMYMQDFGQSIVQRLESPGKLLILFSTANVPSLLLTLQIELGRHLIGMRLLWPRTSWRFKCSKSFNAIRSLSLQWRNKNVCINGLLMILIVSMKNTFPLVILFWGIGCCYMRCGWILRWDTRVLQGGLACTSFTESFTIPCISYKNYMAQSFEVPSPLII